MRTGPNPTPSFIKTNWPCSIQNTNYGRNHKHFCTYPCKYFAVWCSFVSYINALEWVYLGHMLYISTITTCKLMPVQLAALVTLISYMVQKIITTRILRNLYFMGHAHKPLAHIFDDKNWSKEYIFYQFNKVMLLFCSPLFCVCMITSSNESIFALLALCAWNSPVPGEFPAQRPVTRSFGVFFDLRLNKLLS